MTSTLSPTRPCATNTLAWFGLSVLAALFAWSCGDDDATNDPPQARLCGSNIEDLEFLQPELIADIAELIRTSTGTVRQGQQFDPVFSKDGLTLFFSSDHETNFQVYRATRPSVDEPFDTLIHLNSDVNRPKPVPQFPGDRAQVFGFQPLEDLGLATIQADYEQDLDRRFYLGELTADGYVWTPTLRTETSTRAFDNRLASDGLTLAYADAPRATDSRDLFFSQRARLSEAFTQTAALDGVNTPDQDESAPSLTDEGLLFVRRSSNTNDDIWFAQRTEGDFAFGSARALDPLNSDAFDGEPVVYSGETRCELVFVSSRDPSLPYRLYRSVLRPR
jgi:hypothetical protein